jgi:hypothetical protein
MPTKKLKLEVFDAKGNRYTLTFKGDVSRDKVLNLLDLMDLLGGVTEDDSRWRSTSNSVSKFDKLCQLVRRQFSFNWFSSKDVQKVYEQEFDEPVSLSTVSTYLARMVDRGFLTRKGSANNMRYRLVTLPQQNAADVIKDNK